MARKSNYRFERMERDRAKAAKAAEQTAAKRKDREVAGVDDPSAARPDTAD